MFVEVQIENRDAVEKNVEAIASMDWMCRSLGELQVVVD